MGMKYTRLPPILNNFVHFYQRFNRVDKSMNLHKHQSLLNIILFVFLLFFISKQLKKEMQKLCKQLLWRI